MLTPPYILLGFGFFAWCLAYGELTAPIHHAIAELAGLESFSKTAFIQEQWIEQITVWGILVGFAFFGPLSDRLGRFRVGLWCLLLTPLLSCLACLAGSSIDFAALRFLHGAVIGGLLLASTVLLFESSAKMRAVCQISFPAILMGLFGCMEVWRWLCGPSEDSWRVLQMQSDLTLLILAALIVIFCCRYHDEPKPWKLQIRDKDAEPTSFSLQQRMQSWPRKNFLYAVLIATILFGGIYSIATVGSELVSKSCRLENAKKTGHADSIQDAALIAYLLRFPQLLDTKEIQAMDFSVIPEKFAASDESLSSDLFQGLLRLHEQKRAIHRDNLIDQALVQWNERTYLERQPGAISIPDLLRFSQLSTRYLELGEAAWPVLADHAEQKSGAERWEERKTTLKTLLSALQKRLERRQVGESQALTVARHGFFFGGLLGIASQLLLRRICLRQHWLRRRRILKKLQILWGLMSVAVCPGLFLFRPTAEQTEFTLILIYTPILGFCAVPFFAGLCMSLPEKFPVFLRGTATGLALALGGMATLPV